MNRWEWVKMGSINTWSYRRQQKARTSVQRSTLFCANIVKKDPGRARQNSQATAGTNFTKPGAHSNVDLCKGCLSYPDRVFTLPPPPCGSKCCVTGNTEWHVPICYSLKAPEVAGKMGRCMKLRTTWDAGLVVTVIALVLWCAILHNKVCWRNFNQFMFSVQLSYEKYQS